MSILLSTYKILEYHHSSLYLLIRTRPFVMKMFSCCILQTRHTAIDMSNLMDLSMTTVKKVSHS